MRRLTLALLCGVSLSSAQAAIEVPNPAQVGTPVVVRVVDARGNPRVGASVRLLVGADLPGATAVSVGVTDARGELTWTPESPGRVRILSGDESAVTRVAWPSAPPSAAVGLGLLGVGALALVALGLSRPPLRRR